MWCQRLSNQSLLLLLCLASSSVADISGFDTLQGWSYNQGDDGVTANLVDSETIQLTSGRGHRGVFYEVPQNITEFEASFTYLSTRFRNSLVRQGLAFVVQSNGSDAIGGGAGGFGYEGIRNSIAVTIEGDTDNDQTYSGLYTGGTLEGRGSVPTAPVNAFEQKSLDVSIVYSSPTLAVTILEEGGDVFERSFITGDLATVVGSDHAYVGFTASGGDRFSNGGADQFVSNFRFTTMGSSDCNNDGVTNVVDANCIDIELLPAFLNELGLPRGDADGDGQVQLSDFLILSENYRMPAEYTGGDFDKSGLVDLQDFVILANNFGSSTSEAESVPEPSAIHLLCIATLILPRRIRRARR